MKVLIWPADGENNGSAQYRLLQPARCLASLGYPVEVQVGRGPRVFWTDVWDKRYPPPKHVRLAGLAARPDADVVVLQRPGRRYWADVIPYLQRTGIRVVVDVDDRFDVIHQGNGAYREFDPSTNSTMNHEWIDRACQLADVVTCTTKDLKTRYGYGHGIVLPNLIPESYLKVEHQPRVRAVGWSGHVGTHPDDLQMTKGAVGRALDSDPTWAFLAIGSPWGVRDALGLSRDPMDIGWAPFREYASELSKLTIGIVPLENSPFNAGKSSLKMSEMAAVGVPVVASPTPDNVRLNKLGVGLIAHSPAQWERYVKQLMADPIYRRDLSDRGREVMSSQTYEGHAERWWMAWTGSKIMMKTG